MCHPNSKTNVLIISSLSSTVIMTTCQSRGLARGLELWKSWQEVSWPSGRGVGTREYLLSRSRGQRVVRRHPAHYHPRFLNPFICP